MGPEQIVIVAIAAIVAVVLLVVGVISVRSEKDLVEERLGQYEQEYQSFLDLEKSEEDIVAEDNTLRQRLSRVIEERPIGKKWRLQLARADLKITVFEYAALHVLAPITFFGLGFYLIFSGDLIMSTVAGFIGFFTPRLLVARMTAQRLTKFETQLPDTLGLWVNALRSGFSVLQAMEAIGKDAPEPTGSEFKRVVQEVQIGIDIEDALQHLLDRMESEDLDLVITAVNIQREVGGNLAEILDVISHTIRERIKLKGEIRVLTAQGRITGYVISGLPILLALFLYGINREYMRHLFEDRACGWPLLGIGLAMIGIGTAVIQKIVDIEI